MEQTVNAIVDKEGKVVYNAYLLSNVCRVMTHG